MTQKALKPYNIVFLLAVMAGLFIGLRFVYSVIANVTDAEKIVGGLVFSLGLFLTIVLGGDLFTSTTLTVLPLFSKKITVKRFVSNWGAVYIGNFIGSLVLVSIILLSDHPFSDGGDIGVYYITLSMKN